MADNSTRTMRLSDQVAEEIRVLLVRRRRSASDLARQIGMTQPYLSRRLTGEVALDLDDLQRIAHALDVDVRDLLPARGVNYASSPATLGTMPAPAPRHPVTVGQTATAVAVRTRTIGPRTSRPLWRHG